MDNACYVTPTSSSTTNHSLHWFIYLSYIDILEIQWSMTKWRWRRDLLDLVCERRPSRELCQTLHCSSLGWYTDVRQDYSYILCMSMVRTGTITHGAVWLDSVRLSRFSSYIPTSLKACSLYRDISESVPLIPLCYWSHASYTSTSLKACSLYWYLIEAVWPLHLCVIEAVLFIAVCSL